MFRSEYSTELAPITGRFSQWYNIRSGVTLTLLLPGDPVQPLPGLVLGDDSLQVTGQGLHDSLDVLLQPLHHDVSQR